MQYLAAQRMTGVTRVRKLAAIRKFFTFLEENRILAANPGNAVKGARREEKEPNIWDCLKTGPEACWQVDTFSGQLTGAQSPQNNMITSV